MHQYPLVSKETLSNTDTQVAYKIVPGWKIQLHSVSSWIFEFEWGFYASRQSQAQISDTVR